MRSYIVSEMSEIGLLCPYPPAESYCIIDKLMTMMRFLKAESIDHKGFHAFEVRDFCIINALHVCNICKSSYTITKNGELTMHHPDWDNIYFICRRLYLHDGRLTIYHSLKIGTTCRKLCYDALLTAHVDSLMRLHSMQTQMRDTWIEMLLKAIRHSMMQSFHHIILRIDIHIAKETEWAKVVYSCHMIIMYVRQEHSIQFSEVWQYLLTEVWTTIYEHTKSSARLKKRGST